MKRSIMARRLDRALNRINAAASFIAAAFGLESEYAKLATAHHKKPGVSRVFQTEAFAEFVSSLKSKIENDYNLAAAADANRIPPDFWLVMESVKGLGPSKIDAMKEAWEAHVDHVSAVEGNDTDQVENGVSASSGPSLPPNKPPIPKLEVE